MIKINNKAVPYIICSVICGAIVSGVIHSDVFAEDVNYEVNIASGINITIPSDTVTLNLNPFATAFGSTNLPVTVKTNNPTGYTLTMSPSDDTTTSLTRTGGTETIPTLADLSGGYTEQTFTTNKWGYKLSSTNYLPFATSNEITTTNAPTAASGNTSTVTFAAKGDTTLTAGTYSLEITFAAVTNYVPPADVPTTCNTPVPGNYTYLQDINSSNKASVLASLTEGNAYYLRDSRDNEPYCISKLADGNLWFLDNLRLDLTDTTVLANTTADNTNASTTTLNYLKNGGGSTSDQYATAAVSNWTSDYSYSAPLVNMASKDVVPTGAPTGGSGSNKVGGYYNFCAASAGSYCYGNGTSQGTSSGDAGEDICPAGWRMPTGGSSGEYQVLANAITGGTSSSLSGDDATNFKNALSTPLSGRFNDGSAYYQGSSGVFWSSTRYDDFYMYILLVYSSYVYPQRGDGRGYGYSVRCLLQ